MEAFCDSRPPYGWWVVFFLTNTSRGPFDRYCKSQGYSGSISHVVMSYSHKSTFVLGMDAVNKESHERGLGSHSFFSSINCVSATQAAGAVTTAFAKPAT